MKRLLYIFLILVGSLQFFSCANEDYFLEKRLGSDVTVDSIFTTKQKSMVAIAQAYAMSLQSGITIKQWDSNRTNGLRGGTLSHLSGEVNALKFSWQDVWKIQRSGMTANEGDGKPLSTDGFVFNYQTIRQCYLVIDNIDKVVDLTPTEKKAVKAEMLTLIAYRYQEMFKRYGGVPIVDKLLDVNSQAIPRATLKQTLDHIITLCDAALTDLPDTYNSTNKGRVTKGIPLCIKAEALMFAARPLFNTATPYMSLGANNNLICLGTEDPSLWQKAVEANLEVLNWAIANGYAIINTGNPFKDYGTAVATPNNQEVLLAFKSQQRMNDYDPHTQEGGANAMSYLQLTHYYKADGTEQQWAAEQWQPYNDFVQKAGEMEARYKVSVAIAGQQAWNNPDSYNWSTHALYNASNWDGGSGGTEGAGRRVKFYYMADTRDWFEFPLYRLAEFYLNLAEPYNELGNPSKALEYLNVIHTRAGLPAITETNKEKLRAIVQREWAIEFYEENHRLFDVKHWKLNNLGDGVIGGDKKGVVFQYASGRNNGENPWDYLSYAVRTVYVGYWANNQYLDPFPIAEINKGYIIQNPGY